MAGRATFAAVTCALLLSVTGGCGAGTETTKSEDPEKALAKWYSAVEDAVAKMEEKQRGFTQFRVVAQPPGKNDLIKLSAAGVRAGETASNSADQLSQLTTLSREEARGLYCYFFAFYVDLEFFPGQAEFEKVIFNLVKADALPSTTPAEIHASADGLREAMIKAEKAPDPATKVAAGILC